MRNSSAPPAFIKGAGLIPSLKRTHSIRSSANRAYGVKRLRIRSLPRAAAKVGRRAKKRNLRREANSRFGFSAKTTLALAQTLYEKHKALTYPRTDSRALPEDTRGMVK